MPSRSLAPGRLSGQKRSLATRIKPAHPALAVDDGRAKEGATPPEITVLRQAGLASSAQYRYRIGGERPGQFKVRIDVFRDEAAATQQFRAGTCLRRWP